MTRFLAAQLSTSHWFDISAARNELGYQPRVSTAEGMRRLADWLRQTALSGKLRVRNRNRQARRPSWNRALAITIAGLPKHRGK